MKNIFLHSALAFLTNCLPRYLDFMIDGYNGPIRPQDFKVIYQSVATSPQGISALIQFLTTKLDRIVNEVINGERVATSIYSILASSVALDEEIAKVCEYELFAISPLTIFLLFYVDRRLEEKLIGTRVSPKKIQRFLWYS